MKKLILLLTINVVFGRPQLSTVVTTTTTPTTVPTTEASSSSQDALIDRLQVTSNITYRYATTQIQSFVKNPSTKDSKAVKFEVILPEKAFISNFTIETGGKVFVSRIEKKQEAKEIYDAAVNLGQSAGIINKREGNVFAVEANVAAADKILFTLTYEQLLERRLSRYEHVINVNPQNVVNDFKIDVYINESLPVVGVNVPELKTSENDITSDLKDNEIAVIRGANTTQVHIQYHPTADVQRLKGGDKGLDGQLIVQYDVDRKEQSSEVQVMDGYFVHFFAPENLQVLPKHVVFVLDVSGSMAGTKMVQVKDAMIAIFDDLEKDDYFSILTFNRNAEHWQSDEEVQLGEEARKRPVYQATKANKKEAIKFVLGLIANGGTNIYDALIEAIEVVNNTKSELSDNLTPTILFLTDGEPTAGLTNPDVIMSNLRDANVKLQIPIYGLAFGRGADFILLQQISKDNRAFARKIFEASDATIQLENFYAEISNPVLDNIKFDYVGGIIQTAENVLPSSTFFKGSEMVIVGQLTDPKSAELVVSGDSLNGDFESRILPCEWSVSVDDHPPYRPCIPHIPQPPRQINFIERLWAHLTIEKLLDDKADNGDLTKEDRESRAVDLALQYNFVTDMTSLVVVKPSDNSTDVSEKVHKIESVSDLKNFAQSQFSVYSANSYAYAAPHNSAPPLLNFPQPKRRPQYSILTKSAAAPTRRTRPTFSRPSFNPTTTNSIQTTTTFRSAIHDVFADSFDEEEEDEVVEETAVAPTCDVSQCKLVLYGKTLLRGDGFQVTADQVDLSLVGYDDKVTSLNVIGSCRWELYEDVNYEGSKEVVESGEYKNAVSLGSIFREASSIKLLGC